MRTRNQSYYFWCDCPDRIAIGEVRFRTIFRALEESARNSRQWMAAARTRAAADRNFAVDDPKGASMGFTDLSVQ